MHTIILCESGEMLSKRSSAATWGGSGIMHLASSLTIALSINDWLQINCHFHAAKANLLDK